MFRSLLARLRPPKTPPIVTLTPLAAREVASIARSERYDRFWLRVDVTRDGAESGFLRYVLDIVNTPPDPAVDEAFRVGKINIAITHANVPLLEGTVVDFHDDDRGKGFYFHNPNAKT